MTYLDEKNTHHAIKGASAVEATHPVFSGITNQQQIAKLERLTNKCKR